MTKNKAKKRFLTKGGIIGFVVGLAIIAAGFFAYNYFFSCSKTLLPPTNGGGYGFCGWNSNNIWSDPSMCRNFQTCCYNNTKDYWRCQKESQKCTNECVSSKCDVKLRNCRMTFGSNSTKCDTQYDECKGTCRFE
ncbi:MAG: hypothetical protein WC107_01085 [Patescibacteria group bacterium]